MKTVILFVLAIAALSIYLASCSQAKSDDLRIELLKAPDNSQCYVILQGADVRGGNCK
jgi:hypothetical protein